MTDSILTPGLTLYQRAQRLLRYHEIILVGFLLLCALVIRFHTVRDLMVFTYDQGRDMYVLQEISRGNLTLIGPTTGLQGVFLGPYYYYFLLPGFILTNGNPFGVVTWQMSVIVLSFIFWYLILRQTLGRWWALVGVIWLSLTPGAIEQARKIWNPSLVVMTLLPSIWALFTSRQKPWLLPISLFFFGLSWQTELAYTVFLAPLFAAWMFCYTRWPKPLTSWLPAHLSKRLSASSKPYTLKVFILSVLAFFLTFGPQVLFELRHDFLITTSFLQEMADTSKQVPYQFVWQTRPTIIATEVVNNMTGAIPGGQVVWLLIVAASLYIIWKLHRSPEAWFWLGCFWLPVLGFMLHRGNNGHFFDYYLSPHYLPAIAVLLTSFAFAVRQLKFNRLLAGALLMVVVAVVFLRYTTILYNINLFQYTAATQMQALYAARELTEDENAALEVFVPNLLPVAYQYLSEWMSRTGQAEPMPFGAEGASQYVLLYEPIMGDGSLVAFEAWYASWTTNAECSIPAQFGITTVQVCERMEN